MANDPQVPWTDEQWARVNQVIQEEAKRARVAATFLPLYGPLDADADFVRRQEIWYAGFGPERLLAAAEANRALQEYRDAATAGNDDAALAAQGRFATAEASVRRQALGIDDRDTMRLATLQVIVPVRNAQMADPEMASALVLFRRAANVIARLEDAIVFRGLAPEPAIGGAFAPPAGLKGLPGIWQITGASEARGLWSSPSRPGPLVSISGTRVRGKSPAARSRDIRRRWPAGTERTFRSICSRAGSTIVSCRPDPGPGVAHPAAGPHHSIPGRRPTVAFLNAWRLYRRGCGARRRAARTGRRHRHEPAVSSAHLRAIIQLSRIREDCASHQGT